MAKKILIVDDEPDLVKALQIRLKRAGYRVLSAYNADECLKLARKKPDLILLDIMMPTLSGIEVCQLLKEDPKLKNIPIIFLTAKDTKEDRIKGLSVGADEYIAKPFYSEDLLNKIKKALERKQHG